MARNKMERIKNTPASHSDLRVISGRFRGVKLASPHHSATHPMGAREKLALFNMVNVTGEVILDAYAGSGALGIEALSRGAEKVVFVEASRAVAKVLQANLATIDAEDDVYIEKVGNFTERAEYQEYFSVILADPPYDDFQVDEVNKLVQVLQSGGVLVLSSPAELGEITLEGVRISSSHTYARARVTIYRKD